MSLFTVRLSQGMAVAALAAVAFAASPRAEASTLNFALTGDYTANWTLDSDPTPAGLVDPAGGFYLTNVSGLDPSLNLIFLSTSEGLNAGGIRASTGLDLTTKVGAIFDLANSPPEQIYSGTRTAPHFAPGVYHFNLDYVGSGTSSTLTISATPIPAALPLFATALAGLGFVGWRRRNQACA